MSLSRWRSYLINDHDFSESDFEEEAKLLAKKFFGEESKRDQVQESDIIWSLYNQLVACTIDLQQLSEIYYTMALFLNDEGRPHDQLRRLSAKTLLQSYKESAFVDSVEVISAGHQSCKHCQEVDGKRFTLMDAMKKMPIPVEGCSHELFKGRSGFCRCTYGPVVE